MDQYSYVSWISIFTDFRRREATGSTALHYWFTQFNISLGKYFPFIWIASENFAETSLVPRPFPPPVFDRILYAKTEGEGLGERVTCVTSGRREGRHTGGR